MPLSVTVVVLNLGDIFYLFLDGAGVDTCCRRVVALTLSLLAPSASGTSLVVLVLFRAGRGSLLSGR